MIGMCDHMRATGALWHWPNLAAARSCLDAFEAEKSEQSLVCFSLKVVSRISFASSSLTFFRTKDYRIMKHVLHICPRLQETLCRNRQICDLLSD